MPSSIMRSTEESTVLSVSSGAKKIFQAIYRADSGVPAADDNIPKLQVSDLISKMAFYYEKLRNAVHYTEDHLLRKDAIFRILKRQLIIENPMKFNGADNRAGARHLLIELTRAGYLPNNTLPETKVDEAAKIIEKYLALRRIVASNAAGDFNFFGGAAKGKEFDSRGDLTNWLIGLAAAEIEELIAPDEIGKTITSVMYSILEKKIELPASLPYEHDLPIQLYLAIHRGFMKYDDDMLSLILLRYFNGDWQTATAETVRRVAKNLSSLHRLINEQLKHPLSGQLARIVSSYTVFFNVLKDVISEDPVAVYDEFFDDPKSFSRRIKKACAKRYTAARTKLWRAAWRSIIYILLTKSVFVVLLEVPASQFFGELVNPIALTINVIFPAFLLFFAVAVTRLPGADNTKRTIAGIEEIVFTEKRRAEPILLRKPLGRHPVMNVFFGLFYAVTFFISFGLIVWGLRSVQFSWVSITIFLFFLTFVSFFIIRVRRSAKEWVVVESRETILRFLLDFFSVPIVATGKWLSNKFARLNVFAFVLDFIIEAPFKIFVDIAEEWTKYVRERKEQL